MQNEIQFDFTKAQNLIATLEDCQKKLAAAAKEVQMAAPVPLCIWWFDDAQQAYAERYSQALPNMIEYGQVINDTLNYLKNVSRDKSDFEKAGKNRFR